MTTRVVFTDRQVIVCRPLVYPVRFPYSEIERISGPGMSEEDPMWGFTIETPYDKHQFPMFGASRVSSAFAEVLAERETPDASL